MQMRRVKVVLLDLLSLNLQDAGVIVGPTLHKDRVDIVFRFVFPFPGSRLPSSICVQRGAQLAARESPKWYTKRVVALPPFACSAGGGPHCIHLN